MVESRSVLTELILPGGGVKLRYSEEEEEEKADKASARKARPNRSSPLMVKNPEEDCKVKPMTPRSKADAERVAKQKKARQQVVKRQEMERQDQVSFGHYTDPGELHGPLPSQRTQRKISLQEPPTAEASSPSEVAAVDSAAPPRGFFGAISGVDGEALHAGRLRLTQVAPEGGPEQLARSYG